MVFITAEEDNVELTSSLYSFHFETLLHKLATWPFTYFHTSSTCSVVCSTSSDILFLDPGKVTQQATKGYYHTSTLSCSVEQPLSKHSG